MKTYSLKAYHNTIKLSPSQPQNTMISQYLDDLDTDSDTNETINSYKDLYDTFDTWNFTTISKKTSNPELKPVFDKLSTTYEKFSSNSSNTSSRKSCKDNKNVMSERAKNVKDILEIQGKWLKRYKSQL